MSSAPTFFAVENANTIVQKTLKRALTRSVVSAGGGRGHG